MIQIVFQNENFIVCDKPAQVLSVPGRDRNDSRLCLGLALQDKFQKPVFPVHRLDYEVSGLIIYALNAKAHKESQDWFLKKTITKKYVAETSLQNFDHWPENILTDRTEVNPIVDSKFYWTTQIQRGKKRSFESKHGEWAETEAIVTKIENDKITWNLFPLTGKSHQLRLELSRRGFPIHGDVLYGAKEIISSGGIRLKAIELNLSRVHNKMGLPTTIQIDGLL